MTGRSVAMRVYLGRDNRETLVLAAKQEGRTEQPLADLSGITRVVLSFADEDFDSDVLGASVIWWSDAVEYPPRSRRYVHAINFQLGSAVETAGVAAGEYTADLLVYDATYTNGRIFSENGLTVEVI